MDYKLIYKLLKCSLILILFTNQISAQIMLPAYQGVFSQRASAVASNGLDFDGMDDRVISTNDIQFKISVGTIEGWIKTGNAGSSYRGAFGKTFAYFLFLYNNELIVYDWGGSSNRSTGITLNDNTWHHIAMSFNSGVSNGTLIYIDGVLKLTTTITVLNQDQPFSIGGVSSSHSQFYTGSIDDVRVWNVARTQAEIQANMNTELTGTEAGLKAYYTFNQGVAAGNNTAITTVTDKTANALTGTLYNFTKTGTTSNFVLGKVPSITNGLSAANASTSAYQIKKDFPASADGIYWIKNANINGGNAFQIYADMTTDGGGWTLIMCNVSNVGWTFANAISLNTSAPSISSNYSIIGWADYIKKSASGFQYMMEANSKNRYGGIWTANQAYSFVKTDNTQTDVTRNIFWDTYDYDLNNSNSIQPRMPWRSTYNNAFITTDDGSGNWWGTLVSNNVNYSPAPWIDSGQPHPGKIWYWVR